MDISRLKPFSGLHSSLISFSSGHLFRISHWTATPTEFGAFSNVWIVTPEGRRLLFSDPGDSDRVVRIYHKFDEALGAEILVERPDALHVDVHVRADDSTKVELNLGLKRSLMTKLLVMVSRATPLRWKSMDPTIRLADSLTSMFVGRGRMKSAGRTDTGQPFFSADIDDLLIVKDGRAALNGVSLGSISLPSRPVAFGDFGSTQQASIMVGRLYLEYLAPGA